MSAEQSVEVGQTWWDRAGHVHKIVCVGSQANPRDCIVVQNEKGAKVAIWRHTFLREFRLIKHEVKAITGRWQGVGAEWTVAVGFRVVFDAPGGYTFVVSALAEDTVTLRNVTLSDVKYVQVITHASFFAAYRPAPVASRWLDPASVPVGAHPWRPCGRCRVYPAQVKRESTGCGADFVCRCSYCADLDKRAVNHPARAERVEASVLTPATRWRSLLGTKWSCGKPERLDTSLLVSWLFKHEVQPAYAGRPMRGSRMYKVRAPSIASLIPTALDAAKWVRA